VSAKRKVEYKKSEESRAQVIDAAISVLADKGITGTSVQEIADAAGISKGSIHYHFASKEELLERVLQRCFERIEVRVREAFELPGGPLERMNRALYEMWAVRRDGEPEVRVLTELHVLARQNASIRKAFAAEMRKARQQMIDIGLKQLIEMGLKPRVPVEVLPRMLVAKLDGLALQYELEPFSKEEEEAVLAAIHTTAIALFEI
jgi:AcrR family transcriptional regulator